jgi:hypothetical protein
MSDSASFQDFMDGCRRSAFKFESRRSYVVAEEEAAFRAFSCGEDPGLGWLRNWLDTVRVLTRRGPRVERVRVIDVPPSDYLRFELAVTPHNLAAGEDIRYLDRARSVELDLPEQDYWLFDSAALLLVNFNGNDVFQGFEPVTNPARVAGYAAARDAAWQAAEPYTDYHARQPT